MSMLLRGAPAAAALNEKTAQLVSGLREKGVVPMLAIVRLGAREDDLSYERAAVKRCAAVGIETRCVSLPENASGEALEETLRSLSDDASVHGILLLRPLPAALDEARILRAIAPEKDVDGAAEGSLAAVYAGTDEGFAPCTAQAVLELLETNPLGEITISDVQRRSTVSRSTFYRNFDSLEDVLALLCEAYDEEVIDAEKNDTRVVLHLSPVVAPYKAAVLPLSKKLSEEAIKICDDLSRKFMVDFDETGSIGKRYRRQDEIGTPLCITYDFDSVDDHCVTVRDRDTMKQERIAIDELERYIASRIEF